MYNGQHAVLPEGKGKGKGKVDVQQYKSVTSVNLACSAISSVSLLIHPVGWQI